MRLRDPQKTPKQMPSELTKKLLQMFAENAALKKQVRWLQSQVEFLKQNCDLWPPGAPGDERARLVRDRLVIPP